MSAPVRSAEAATTPDKEPASCWPSVSGITARQQGQEGPAGEFHIEHK
jgi:hypothetical protein